METTPKSLRLQIGIFGRTNVGKSSFLNMVSGQDVAITSPTAGTTTDVVEKVMELLPIGPVVFLDTAGTDDLSELGALRVQRTEKVYRRAEVAVLVAESEIGPWEEQIIEEVKKVNLPLITVFNKCDIQEPSAETIERMKSCGPVISVSATAEQREAYVQMFKNALIAVVPEEFLVPQPLIGDLLPSGGHAVFVVPIDLQAPKGRLILPQVQAIRDILDADAIVSVVKEREYRFFLDTLKRMPDLVVCDSQVVQKVVADTPDSVKLTTFSTLFARFKGELLELVRGVAALASLKSGDRVLIAESCSHHSMEDDIGRVKIPRWVKQYAGADIQIDHYAGRDYPQNLTEYKVIIHCGSCMLTRREMLMRIDAAKGSFIPITNYGLTISFVQGVFKRVLSPFPAALALYESEMEDDLY